MSVEVSEREFERETSQFYLIFPTKVKNRDSYSEISECFELQHGSLISGYPHRQPWHQVRFFDEEKCYEQWTYKDLNAEFWVIRFLSLSRSLPVTYRGIWEEDAYWPSLMECTVALCHELRQYVVSLPCFAWSWIWVRGSRAAALKGTKSCRTQGDFRSSCLQGLNGLFWCLRGLIWGLNGWFKA